MLALQAKSLFVTGRGRARASLDAPSFTTFGQIIALGLNAKVYCCHCYEHRSIAVAEMLLRNLLPSWEINHVPIDQPSWSMVDHKSNDRFKCPGCGKAVAWRIHGPAWRPAYGLSAPSTAAGRPR